MAEIKVVEEYGGIHGISLRGTKEHDDDGCGDIGTSELLSWPVDG